MIKEIEERKEIRISKKYMTDDGTLFNNYQDARLYDLDLKKVDEFKNLRNSSKIKKIPLTDECKSALSWLPIKNELTWFDTMQSAKHYLDLESVVANFNDEHVNHTYTLEWNGTGYYYVIENVYPSLCLYADDIEALKDTDVELRRVYRRLSTDFDVLVHDCSDFIRQIKEEESEAFLK